MWNPSLEFFHQPDRRARLLTRDNRIPCLTFEDARRFFKSLPVHRRLLLMYIVLAIQDRVSELRFEPEVDDSSVFMLGCYSVFDGQVYDLLPLPWRIAAEVHLELRRMAQSATIRQRIARALRTLASSRRSGGGLPASLFPG